MIGFLDCFDDKEEWNGRMELLHDDVDPHCLAEYYQVWGEGKLAFVPSNIVGHPFRRQSENWIGNAYNYGTYEASADINSFELEFSSWKKKNKLNERCTLRPQNQVPQLNFAEIKSKQCVILPLFNQSSLFGCYGNMRPGTQYAIKKAVENDTVTSRANLEDALIFEAMYNAAMTAKNAAPHWFYPDGFFYKLLNVLGPRRSALFLTRVNGEIESGCIVIYSKYMAYYHWAARRGRHSVDAAQIWSVICWAKNEGIEAVSLGGGLTADRDDKLLWFKRGFQWDTLFDTAKTYSFETRYKEE